MAAAERQRSVAALTQRVREMEAALATTVDAEELVALEAALAEAERQAETAVETRVQAAEAAAAEAKLQAARAIVAKEQREEQLATLMQHTRALEQQLAMAVDVEEVEALEQQLQRVATQAEAAAETRVQVRREREGERREQLRCGSWRCPKAHCAGFRHTQLQDLLARSLTRRPLRGEE
jgi:hypothetical protein